MQNYIIRLLRASEIECRVASVNEKGVSILLYKDARVDQRVLDETFGIFGWKRSHQCIDGNLYCTVEIYDKELGEWVSKQDVGTNGYAEKEKSQASDSFKRACFNWGIGRELYTAPFIWVPSEKSAIKKQGDKFYCNDHFSVKSIKYNDEREIIGLSIINGKKQLVYELRETAATKEHMLSSEQLNFLKNELLRTGVGVDAVKERYKIDNLEYMPDELYKRVMMALSKTESVA